MPEAAYLNTDAISSASELLNSTLISKGYINEKILFNTIDWKELVKEQISEDDVPKLNELTVTDKLYNNDKNIINIIYSLLQSIERSKAQNKSFNKVVSQKESVIEDLENRVSSLERQLEKSNKRLERDVEVENIQLNKKLREVSKVKKMQSQDIQKLRNWCYDVKAKYQVELRKKNHEIDQLKNFLLEKRNLSTTLTYGIPLKYDIYAKPSPTYSDENVNSNIIYNNVPSIDNSKSSTQLHPEAGNILDDQYKQIIIDLTQLIENLITENHKHSRFVKQTSDYFQALSIPLANISYKNLDITALETPSKIINFDEISMMSTSDLNSNFDEGLDQVEPFEVACKPLLNNIYKIYHNISYLVELLNMDSASSSNNKNEATKKIEELKAELELVRKNWHDSINTLENWKKYQRNQGKDV